MPAHQFGIGGERDHPQRDNAAQRALRQPAAMEKAGPDDPDALPLVLILPVVHGNYLVFIDDEGIVVPGGLVVVEI